MDFGMCKHIECDLFLQKMTKFCHLSCSLMLKVVWLKELLFLGPLCLWICGFVCVCI